MKKRGRPSEYKPEYCDKIIEYFEDFKTDSTERNYPTITEFARKIGVNRCSIPAWEKNYKDFANALKTIKDLQAEILLKNALNGTYVPSVAIFALKNVAGWRDDRFVLDQSEHQHLTIITKDDKERLNRIDGQAEFSLPAIDQQE